MEINYKRINPPKCSKNEFTSGNQRGISTSNSKIINKVPIQLSRSILALKSICKFLLSIRNKKKNSCVS